MQRQGVAPNVITYNALISTCEKGKKPERAHELLKAMQRQGVVPNVITYSALISTCESGIQAATCKDSRVGPAAPATAVNWA